MISYTINQNSINGGIWKGTDRRNVIIIVFQSEALINVFIEIFASTQYCISRTIISSSTSLG